MHEDPTRLMGEAATPPHGYAAAGEPRGLDSGYKFLIASLVAIILGLIVGVVLVAGSSSDNKGRRLPAVTRTKTETKTDTQTQTQSPQTQTQTVSQTVTTTATVTTTVTAPPGP